MEIEYKNLEFEDEEINQLIKQLNKCFDNQQGNFATVCYTIYKIDCWFDDNPDCLLKSKYTADYYKKNQLFKMLGFSKSQVSKLCQCYKKFMTHESFAGETKIKEPFVSFTSSKLFELLSIGTDKLIEFVTSGQISANMTKLEIREFLKSVEEKEEISNCEDADENITDSTEDYFLVLKNDKMRKDFLDNFKTWGLWFEEPRLKLKYYRCRIGEKVLVAVLGKTEEIYYCDGTKKIYETHKFFYMSAEGELFLDPTCETAILKDMSALEDKKVYLFER